MGKFSFIPTCLSGVYIVEPRVYEDARGYFMETYNEEFIPYLHHLDGTPCTFVQDNESQSVRGVLRGMHMQLTQPQGKLVRVIEGEVYDAVTDVRPGSPTFGKSLGMYLSRENRRQLLVPEGLLHGFLVTSDTARFAYKCTRPYAPQDEVHVRWDDPDMGIDWPIRPEEVILSAKDEAAISYRQCLTLIADSAEKTAVQSAQ